jgi:hypothetical protein
MSVTPEELEGLSDIEREALENDDDLDTGDLPDLGDEDDEEPEAQEPEASAPDQAASPEPFIPVFQAQPVEDYDGKLAALDAQKRELRTQYQDGDLDLDDYEDKRDAIDSEILTLREANLKASLAAEQAQQVQAQRWQWEVSRFLDENPYIKENRGAFLAVDAIIIDLKKTPEHAGKPDRWYLEEAKRMYHDAPRGAADSKPSGKTTRRSPPPSLGDMPAAELSETSGSEWAHLDRLGGLELEAALAKLSPAEQDRYLQA